MEQENFKNIPHESIEAWNLKPWKTMGSMGIYKNESMGNMVFSGTGILFLIVS